MSDHQPDNDSPIAPEESRRDIPQATAMDLPEPDFSRLRLARASLDAAFPQR